MVNMFDEARSIATMLRARSMTQSDIAEKLGVSQPYIANKLRLLSFSEECERLILEYGLTERHARAILRLRGEKQRRDAIERVHERGYTVYECEGLVDMLKAEDTPKEIEAASAPKRLEVFMAAIDDGVRTLKGLGYNIEKRTSYHAGRTYVTISLNEETEHKNF